MHKPTNCFAWLCLVCWAVGFFCLFQVSTPAQARTTLSLDSYRQPVPLLDWGDYWVDTAGALSAAQVAEVAEGKWNQTQPRTVFKLQQGQALWIRFTVPPAPDRERWFVVFPNPSIDRLDLYTLELAGQWTAQSAGDKVPADFWPMPNRYPILPIALSAETPTRYLLRISNNEGFTAPLSFSNEAYLSYQGQSTALAGGVFFGLVICVLLLSVFSAVSLRDQAFALFALVLLLMLLAQASSSGIGRLYLWPEFLRWNDFAYHALKLLALGTILAFAAAALSVRQRSVLIFSLVMALVLVGSMAALAMVWLPPMQRQWVFIPVFLLLQLGGVLLCLWSWRRGDPFAAWLLLSYVPLMLAVNGALAIQDVPMTDNIPTQYAIGVAMLLHLPVAVWLLVLRSKRRWENKLRQQGRDRVDPHTGLINRNLFEGRLLRLIARSERLRHQGMVLLIDIVNTAQIQRDFGHKAAEDLPLRLAYLLQSTLREIDTAARLSELRFGMMVEGPCSAEDAVQAGPKIVARCLMPQAGLHPECVLQVRVAYALVPQQGSNAQGVIAQLEALLERVPADSKRAVFALAPLKT